MFFFFNFRSNSFKTVSFNGFIIQSAALNRKLHIFKCTEVKIGQSFRYHDISFDYYRMLLWVVITIYDACPSPFGIK